MTQAVRDLFTDSASAQRARLMRHTWIEPSPRWVRAYVDGIPIADSKHVLLVFEAGRPTGTYWFPKSDVRMDLMSMRAANEASPTTRWSLRLGDREIDNVARAYAKPDAEHEQLRDYVALYWNEIHAWFEEDDEVYVEPRDPYHRVDVLHSSRHVRVDVDGQTVAESSRPCLVLETLLPVRYYLPKQDVRMELLTPTATSSRCPYKGIASYWSVQVGDKTYPDIVWGYPTPIPECAKVENLMAFYNEKVDIYVDGELQIRPA